MLKEWLAPVAVIGLWVVFAALSLGVALAGGRGPLVRAKLRVGGLLLGMTAVGAGPGCVTCYKDSTGWQSPDSDTGPTCYVDTGPDSGSDSTADSGSDSTADSGSDTAESAQRPAPSEEGADPDPDRDTDTDSDALQPR